MPVRDAGNSVQTCARHHGWRDARPLCGGALKPSAQRLPYTRASPPTQRRRLRRRRGRRGGRRRRRGRRRRWRRRRWRRRIFLLLISGRRRQTSSRARAGASHAGARRRDGRSSFYPRSVRHPSHGLLALSRRRRTDVILYLSDGGDSIVNCSSEHPPRHPAPRWRRSDTSMELTRELTHPRTWVAGVRKVRTVNSTYKINRLSGVL